MSGAVKTLAVEAWVGQTREDSEQKAIYWELARRIAASEIFAKSEFLPKFLLYICDRQLSGKTQEITEQQIGERVFGRQPGYSPGEDNIVRNYAGQLRKRLEMYYEREGKQDAVRISIPRGGYVPVFRPSSLATEATPPQLPPQLIEPQSVGAEPHGLPISPAGTTRNRNRLMFALGASACALAFAAALLSVRALRGRPGYSASHLLWSQLFSRNQDTFIVPADSGVGILQNLTEKPTTLADYANGKYLSDVTMPNVDDANLDDLRTQRYTSIADLTITAKLARLPEVIPDRFVIRYARDLRMDDLRNGNAVLLGAIHADPWVNLLQEGLNFQFVCETHVNQCQIVNRHPAAGEQTSYSNLGNNPSQETFAVIAFLPNLSRTGRLLLIGGLNMAGTEAAADMLLDSVSIQPILQKAKLPDGSLEPFELLVETSSLGAEALPSRIIAARYGQ